VESPTNAEAVTWITDEVAITNYVSAHNKEILAKHGIKGVLCLDRELAGCTSVDRGVQCVQVIHLIDGANDSALFEEAVSALGGLAKTCGRVVVHCRAGRSRSIAVVAAYLIRNLGIGADEALDIVSSKRQSAIAPELVRLVEQLEL
jgi:protein-tyrosine phosphatase